MRLIPEGTRTLATVIAAVSLTSALVTITSAAPGPSRAVAGQSLALASDDILKRARALVAESERNQQRELALRVAEVFRDVQAQRQADLVKIDRSLSLLQNNTGVEVMRQRQLINSLAVRVSQRQ